MCLYESKNVWLVKFKKRNSQLKASLVSQQNICKKESTHNESCLCKSVVAEIIANEGSLFADI
jgi:hypothetical protein